MANHLAHRAKLRAAIINILGDGVQSLTVIQERLGSHGVVVSTIEVRDALIRLDRENVVMKFTNRNPKGGAPRKFHDMEVVYELIKGSA